MAGRTGSRFSSHTSRQGPTPLTHIAATRRSSSRPISSRATSTRSSHQTRSASTSAQDGRGNDIVCLRTAVATTSPSRVVSTPLVLAVPMSMPSSRSAEGLRGTVTRDTVTRSARMGDMRVIGLISGTSHDGVDACDVEFEQEGGRLRADIVTAEVVPYPDELRERIAAALPPNPTSVDEICALDILIGEHFATVALAVGAADSDLVCSHGQTVFHWVEEGRARGGLQLGNLWSL